MRRPTHVSSRQSRKPPSVGAPTEGEEARQRLPKSRIAATTSSTEILDAFSELLNTLPENGFYNSNRDGTASASESSEFEDRGDRRKQLTIEALPSKLADGRRHFMIMLEEGSGMDKISRELRPKKISRRSVREQKKRTAGRRQLRCTK